MPVNLEVLNSSLEERKIRAEMSFICNNPVRAAIVYLLMKMKNSDHCSNVEQMSHKLGKNHSIILHHLEKLAEYGLVEIVRSVKYGDKVKRKIWGLNLTRIELIREVYTYITKFCFTVSQLEKLINVNKTSR